jgi:hypothetical protein
MVAPGAFDVKTSPYGASFSTARGIILLIAVQRQQAMTKEKRIMDDSTKLSRRALIRCTGLGITTLAIGGTALIARAGDSLPHLEESNQQAQALQYTNNSPHKNKHCGNCMFLKGKEGDTWRPCQIFPGKLVNVGGYCNSWNAAS